MLKTAALTALAVTAAVAGTSIAAGPVADTAVTKPTIYDYKLTSTHPFFVDNGDPDTSSGDMFGASGKIESKGHKVGTFASNCVAVLPNGRCGATLVLEGRGRIELSGLFRFSEQQAQSVLAIVGGTRDFRNAGGTATLVPEGKGEIQQVELKVID